MALGTTTATLEYIIKVQDRDLKELKKQIKDTGGVIDESQGKSSKFAGALGHLGTVAKAGAATAFVALSAAAKIGFDEFEQGQKVAAQTNAVLKSTGGVANVTAKEIDDLATSILRKTGIDDEQTKSGENLLLTFTNIRNEVGKGNDIFTQTTKIMTDMSAALGQDTKSSAIQLGKALNDPIKGVTALQRVGVSFTADQKEQIKTLVESGKTMDAQKLILSELNKEFGGSAEAVGKTLPGQINIAKETMKNWAGEMVGKTIPVIEEVISSVRDHWPEIQKVMGQVWDKTKPILTDLKNIAVAIAEVIQDNWPTISKIMGQVWSVASPILSALNSALKLIVDLLHGDWGKAWDDAKSVVSNLLTAIKNLITAELSNIYTVAKSIGSTVKSAILDGLERVGTWFHDAVIQPILNKITEFPGKIGDFGKELFNKFTGFFSGAGIGDWVSGRISAWAGFFRALPGGIADFGKDLFDKFTGFIAGAGIGGWIYKKIGEFADFFGALPGRVADAVKGKADELWDGVKHIFDKLPDFIKTILKISSPSKVFVEIGEEIMNGAIKGIENRAGDLLSTITGHFGSIPGRIAGSIGDILQGSDRTPAQQSLIDVGHALQSLGFQVGENPAFGGVHPVHAPNSYHYQGRAIDVNWPGGGTTELAHLQSILSTYLSKIPHVELMIEDAGTANQHLHLAMAKGGIVTSPTYALIGEAGPEAVIPLNRAGGLGSTINITVEGSVVTEHELVEAVYNGLLAKQTRMPLGLS